MPIRPAFCSIAALLLCVAGAQAQTPPAGPVLDSPECVKAPEARAERDTDEMLCVGRKDEFCAYPLRMMAYHRVVNDHLGGLILVVYDPASGMGRMYDRQIDGKEVFFDAAPARSGLAMMRDRGTGSVWSMLSGEAIEGPLKGRKLAPVPIVPMAWVRWKALHPDSYILKEDPKLSPHYVLRNTLPSCPLSPAELQTIKSRLDKRGKRDEIVVGLEGEHAQVAYPVAALDRVGGVYTAQFENRPIVLFSDAPARAHIAYRPIVDGKVVTFTTQSRNGSQVFLDAASGSVWTLEGVCVEGPLKGKSLEPVSSVTCRWYAWSMTYPKTAVARPRGVAIRDPFFAARW